MRRVAIVGAGLAIGCGPSVGPDLAGHWIVGAYHAAAVEPFAQAEQIRQYEMTEDGAFAVRVLHCDGTMRALDRDRWQPHADDAVLVTPGDGRSFLALPQLAFDDALAVARDDGGVDLHLRTDEEVDGLLTLQPGFLCIAPICTAANVTACE